VIKHGVVSHAFTREAETTKIGSALELTETLLELIAVPAEGYVWYGAIGFARSLAGGSTTVILVGLELVLRTLIEPLQVVPTAPGSLR
jgi:hypothetical protein